ncbi:MAG: four helix bundle protein [Cyclobacteriaceae bacterium]
MAFKFEDLRVWQDALELAGVIHALTLSFPKEELYVLSSQIKRAADSVVLNIAEGSTGQSNPEFNRFLGYSLRSGIEVIACLHLAKNRGLIQKEAFDKNYQSYEKLIISIQALRKTLK